MSLRSVLGTLRRSLESNKNTWPDDKLLKGIMDGYEQRMGYRFDINNPTTFTEKIQWYKLYYNKNNLHRIVDKYLFKGYIEEKLGSGYTIPLIGVWTTIEELEKEWDNLPEQFCLKSTVQSDGNFIKIIKKKGDFSCIKKEVKEWFNPKKTLINSYCKAYHKCIPRVIAEEYVSQIDDQLYDYKFFCFNSEIYCIYVGTDHFDENYNNLGATEYGVSFYDTDWKKMNASYGTHKSPDIPRPIHLNEMVRLSRVLSKGFPFIRVDFFETNTNLYVAELTLYPGGGLTPYHPSSMNTEMGRLFTVPEEQYNV